MRNNRSPLKDKPLRNPGQSVRDQRIALIFDKLLGPMAVALMFLYWALMDWIHYFLPTPPKPWMSSVFASLAVVYTAWQFSRNLPKVRMLRLAEDGEKAVGQLLESLRQSGLLGIS